MCSLMNYPEPFTWLIVLVAGQSIASASNKLLALRSCCVDLTDWSTVSEFFAPE